MKCLVCGKAIDLEGAESKTGETAHGAKEIDPSKGTRQFWIRPRRSRIQNG